MPPLSRPPQQAPGLAGNQASHQAGRPQKRTASRRRVALKALCWQGCLASGALWISLQAGGAKAAVSGMTGVFDPQYWSLNNVNPTRTNGVLSGNYDYMCGSMIAPADYTVGCVSNIAPLPGQAPSQDPVDQTALVNQMKNTNGTQNFVLVGSQNGQNGGGTTGNQTQTEFLVTVPTTTPVSGYRVNFTYAYLGFTDGSPPPTFDILIDGVAQTGSWTANCSPATYNCQPTPASGSASLLLYQTQTLSFRITTYNNSTTTPSITISGFNAIPVPAPLPALGAATAFSFSRRLRRRRAGDPSQAAGPDLNEPQSYLPLLTLHTAPPLPTLQAQP
jgi:hypothetical protein